MKKYDDILKTKIVEEKINESLYKSKKNIKEYGFNICFTGNDITATEVVEGNKYSIILKNNCPGLKIGSFHIHPVSRIVFPSPGDIADFEENEEKFICIGAYANGNRKVVRCFDREDLIL